MLLGTLLSDERHVGKQKWNLKNGKTNNQFINLPYCLLVWVPSPSPKKCKFPRIRAPHNMEVPNSKYSWSRYCTFIIFLHLADSSNSTCTVNWIGRVVLVVYWSAKILPIEFNTQLEQWLPNIPAKYWHQSSIWYKLLLMAHLKIGL